MYGSYYISSVPLSLASSRRRVEDFLASNGLRMAELQYYAVITRNEDSDEILAGGGLDGNVIKCVAVSEAARSAGLANKIISHLIGVATDKGYESVKVYTKPSNLRVFSSLGFQLLASSDQAILMENGFTGLKSYRKYLSSLRREGRNGAIVMNANPFTKGHRYLIEKAASLVDNLYVIAVREERSRFPYAERLAMIKDGSSDIANVTVCEGSDYVISAATFPTYFLKKQDDAAAAQMSLDIDLFARHIAPSLGVTVRFAGTEPADPLTAAYNRTMADSLPSYGIEFVEIPRLNLDVPVTASAVRDAIDGGCMESARKLVYPASLPYLAADFAEQALQRELDTTPKPGLVDKNDSGAHRDMDYTVMQKGIHALRPYFAELAVTSVEGIDPDKVREIGIRAEKAMLEATGGVNTHKGALFCLGLSLAVVSHLSFGKKGSMDIKSFRELLSQTADGIPSAKDTHGAGAVKTYGVSGALENARRAYPELFSVWLPYYRSLEGDAYRVHKTLLKIMTVLDDTNILHRNGSDGLARCKASAASLLTDFSEEDLSILNQEFIRDNISPGGSADMLSLTIFLSQFIY